LAVFSCEIMVMSSFVPLSKIPNFDPRTVPIKAWDTHLPAVPASALTLQALRSRFAQAPVWSPEVREEPAFTDRQPKNAAVLVPIVMRDQPTLLLTQRTDTLSTHSGQIAFPGGKIDAEETAEQAALRETNEEVGIPHDYIEVLGVLPRYITGTAFHITPVVAALQPGFEVRANAGEVADVFEVPLSFLMNPAHHARHDFEFQGHQREWFSMPWLETRANEPARLERYIWGATAGMLRNLYWFLRA
jgi:8-oxo-dGTP pyrophosphatase MutT (NUDIX family)